MPTVVPQLLLPGSLYACLKQKVDWVYLIFVPETEASLASNYGTFISKLLVGETTGGGFETLGGDKTHCFITRTEAYN